MILPAFGLIVLAYVAVVALALATPLAVGGSYLLAAAYKYVSGANAIARIAVQIGVLCLLYAVFTALMVGLLFAGMDGDAGSGVSVFGLDLFGEVAGVALLGALVGAVLSVGVGELVLLLLPARRRPSPEDER